jgi:hypothetical protein
LWACSGGSLVGFSTGFPHAIYCVRLPFWYTVMHGWHMEETISPLNQCMKVYLIGSITLSSLWLVEVLNLFCLFLIMRMEISQFLWEMFHGWSSWLDVCCRAKFSNWKMKIFDDMCCFRLWKKPQIQWDSRITVRILSWGEFLSLLLLSKSYWVVVLYSHLVGLRPFVCILSMGFQFCEVGGLVIIHKRS